MVWRQMKSLAGVVAGFREKEKSLTWFDQQKTRGLSMTNIKRKELWKGYEKIEFI